MNYESIVYDEIKTWEQKVLKRENIFNRWSKRAQRKINEFIPEKAHQMIADSMQGFIKAILVGSNIITKKPQMNEVNLFEQDKQAKEKLNTYQKAAVMEGAGTGAGGILLGLADLPLLLSIKMKYLYDIAITYGFETSDYSERLFMFHIFQLAFSREQHKWDTFYTIKNWEIEKERLIEIDWRMFQQEYRDYLDIMKLLQLIPGFGAIFGAYANHNLMDTLGETTMNAYRMRILNYD